MWWVGSREGEQEFQEQAFGPLDISKSNPFIRSMRMSNVSWTKHDAWNSPLGQDGGIGKIMDASWLVLVHRAQQLGDQ
jgi:hypothetical protein